MCKVNDVESCWTWFGAIPVADPVLQIRWGGGGGCHLDPEIRGLKIRRRRGGGGGGGGDGGPRGPATEFTKHCF